MSKFLKNKPKEKAASFDAHGFFRFVKSATLNQLKT